MNNVNSSNIIPLNKKSSQNMRYNLLDAGKRCQSWLFFPAYSAVVTTATKAGVVTMAVSVRSSSINNFSRILEMPIWRIITGSYFLVKRKTQ